jgi:hypothetical protein
MKASSARGVLLRRNIWQDITKTRSSRVHEMGRRTRGKHHSSRNSQGTFERVLFQRRQKGIPLAKQQKTSAELEDMVHEKLLIGGMYVSVRQDPILGWRATVITAPKHAKAIQERAETVVAELRKKFTLKT